MTRLVVTADADTDTTEILEYLARDAGRSVADDYGRRLHGRRNITRGLLNR
jgi:plasmid stabilization system protein ParE